MSHKTKYRQLIPVKGDDGHTWFEPAVGVCGHILRGGNMLVVASDHQGEVSEMYDYLCAWCHAQWELGKTVEMFELPLSSIQRTKARAE